jgi:DNA-binding MarR family transcriptional regulator
MVNRDDLPMMMTITLIRHHGECIKMKDEDADWLVYHLVAQQPSSTAEGLVSASGLDRSAVEKSLERLERNLLIERGDGRVRALTVGEAILLCQIKNSKDLPYCIENGVIRERRT